MMEDKPDPYDLRQLWDQERKVPGKTFEDRKRLEKVTPSSHLDGRKDRTVTLYLQINFGIEPSEKARIVRLCKEHDIKMADFFREAARAAADKLEGK